jgi:alpha-tubulin suppressor-like RCC1 family protein
VSTRRIHRASWRSLAAALLATACGSTTEPIPAGSILVSPAVDTLPAGTQLQFIARLVQSPGDTIPAPGVLWSSSDPDIAAVTADGLVTGLRSGQATITALVSDERGTAVVQVERRFTASVVAVGPYGVCALDPAGQAWCFGENSVGQLGLGYAGRRTSTFTAPVAGGHSFRTIGLGWAHACALATDGQAWCWGANYTRQLNQTTTMSSAQPMAIDPARTWDTLVVNPSGENCGLIARVTWCWGGGYGSLSRPFGDQTPVLASLAAGMDLNCGLTSEGLASCWWTFDYPSNDSYFGSAVTSVTIGSGFLCAVYPGGIARCQGSNAHGQLGNGSTGDAPSPVAVGGVHHWAALSAGEVSSCGLVTDGTAFCWGANESGQLGTGDSTEVHVPTAVATGLRFRSIATSGATNSGSLFHRTCAITTSDELFCWGADRPPRPAPVVY